MKKIKVPIFDVEIGIFSGGTEEDGREWVSRYIGCYIENYKPSYGFTIRDDDRIGVWLEDAGDHAILAHECRHVTAEILGRNGIDSSKDLEEIEAILIGWTFERIKDALETERPAKQKTAKRRVEDKG
jgi:hypothetical protein